MTQGGNILILDFTLFILYKLLEHMAVKHNRKNKLGEFAPWIIMVGVACLIGHNYISAGEFICFGIRVMWRLLKNGNA